MNPESVKAKILVVDDEPMITEIVAATLRHKGYMVEVAESGIAARQTMESSTIPFDIVVSDLRMPDLNGIDLLEFSKTFSPRTRFVAMTGYSEESVEYLMSLGADHFLMKPFLMEAFVEVIERAVSQSQTANAQAFESI